MMSRDEWIDLAKYTGCLVLWHMLLIGLATAGTVIGIKFGMFVWHVFLA